MSSMGWNPWDRPRGVQLTARLTGRPSDSLCSVISHGAAEPWRVRGCRYRPAPITAAPVAQATRYTRTRSRGPHRKVAIHASVSAFKAATTEGCTRYSAATASRRRRRAASRRSIRRTAVTPVSRVPRDSSVRTSEGGRRPCCQSPDTRTGSRGAARRSALGAGDGGAPVRQGVLIIVHGAQPPGASPAGLRCGVARRGSPGRCHGPRPRGGRVPAHRPTARCRRPREDER